MRLRLPTAATPWRLVLAAALLALAVMGGWRASTGGSPTLDERVADVATGLRCPACEGQSVAASESDLARQMRLVVRQQLADGRSEAQVRTWFAERYGDSVLLDPPAHGLGIIAFAVPVLAVAFGVGVLVRFLRGPGRLVPTACAGAVAVIGGLALAAVAASQGGGTGSAAPGALAVTTPPTVSPSLSLPPQAVLPAPAASGAPTVRQALTALEGGDAAQAERLAESVLAGHDVTAATKTDALLVLGLAQRSLGDPAGEVTLKTFLAQAPDHPAAAQVRRLLTSPSR
jgi:cytochrome c-type biogenesis protein CcmH